MQRLECPLAIFHCKLHNNSVFQPGQADIATTTQPIVQVLGVWLLFLMTNGSQETCLKTVFILQYL